jgi:hypothetical protein
MLAIEVKEIDSSFLLLCSLLRVFSLHLLAACQIICSKDEGVSTDSAGLVWK